MSPPSSTFEPPSAARPDSTGSGGRSTLASFCQLLEKRYGDKLDERGIEYLGFAVDGDPTLLTMVWQNLIGNAVKFRGQGVVPRIAIDYRADDGGSWLFSVSDNGIGIGEEFVNKVFIIFQRLHGRDTYSGTGIGLALCKKIVEHHGGAIWIDTSYSGGTRVEFSLPRVEGNCE